jgi:hypothetical protein
MIKVFMVILLKVVGFEGEHFSALDLLSAESVPAMRGPAGQEASH